MGRNLRAWFGLKAIICSPRLHIKSSPYTGAQGESSIVRNFSHPLESLWAHYHSKWYWGMGSCCQIATSMFTCASVLGWMLLISLLLFWPSYRPLVSPKPFIYTPIRHIFSVHIWTPFQVTPLRSGGWNWLRGSQIPDLHRPRTVTTAPAIYGNLNIFDFFFRNLKANSSPETHCKYSGLIRITRPIVN
jgi:hypothetical protein